jgi:hypothetical protein
MVAGILTLLLGTGAAFGFRRLCLGGHYGPPTDSRTARKGAIVVFSIFAFFGVCFIAHATGLDPSPSLPDSHCAEAAQAHFSNVPGGAPSGFVDSYERACEDSDNRVLGGN